MIKKLLMAAAGLLIAAPVLADGGHRYDRHYKHHYKHYYKHHSHWKHRAHRPVVVMPPPRVFYAPPPRVVYAPPPRVVYAPPAPVYYAPPPRPIYHAPASGISIRLHFPL